MARYKKLEAGSVVKFTYKFHTGALPDEPQDDFKEVLVLHPNWSGKMHGIDLKRLTMAEREVLDAIFNKEQQGKPHRLPLVNDILRRMDPLEDVKNPMTFYSKFVKVFIRNKDAYRTYYPRRMLSVVVVDQSNVSGKVINPKPLFHKVETPKAPEPAKPVDRMALIKQRAQAAKTPVNRADLIKQRAQAAQAARKPTPAKPATPAEPAKPVDRLALIRQRAQQAKKPK